MAQFTHECNGIGLLDYPKSPEVKDVNVYIHDSGMAMTHDYSCPVCREKHAVLSEGLMQPCWGCQAKGYELVNKSQNLVERIKQWL